MIGLLQRVTHASVAINSKTVAKIEQGLLVLAGIEKDDNNDTAEQLVNKIINYRVFEDKAGKMNNSLKDIDGGLLLVPQFTLTANTDKGRRPGFSGAANPELSRGLFDYLTGYASAHYPHVRCGLFGADMQVSLTNDGPVTFWLKV